MRPLEPDSSRSVLLLARVDRAPRERAALATCGPLCRSLARPSMAARLRRMRSSKAPMREDSRGEGRRFVASSSTRVAAAYSLEPVRRLIVRGFVAEDSGKGVVSFRRGMSCKARSRAIAGMPSCRLGLSASASLLVPATAVRERPTSRPRACRIIGGLSPSFEVVILVPVQSVLSVKVTRLT